MIGPEATAPKRVVFVYTPDARPKGRCLNEDEAGTTQLEEHNPALVQECDARKAANRHQPRQGFHWVRPDVPGRACSRTIR